uniref:Uncharacterized protein n=1 Tax=Caenorhabditis japonica TaxID=281687 RepID=A0A8R1EUV2_CAEJA
MEPPAANHPPTAMFPRSRLYHSYYSEEKTFSAPSANTQKGSQLPSKVYNKGLKDLEDNDIEGLLSKLSMDELEDLNNDFDPDVSPFHVKMKLFQLVF